MSIKEFSVDRQCMAMFRKVPEGYIAFVEGFSGANTQGTSLEEARWNIREAIALVVETNGAFGLAPMEEPQ
ncbi:MAG: type II toxin-antitoxin system HicB family antitoxin [Gemmatimonadetes bacterium]|nr:type II toxin-antitoxin system HicB family antitoxin [Candidatus Palauibacter rhopaloidicola]